MRKAIITILSVFLVTMGLFFLRYHNLDTFQWNSRENIISFGDIQYKYNGVQPNDLKLAKEIGKIEGDFIKQVWEVKGKKREDYIASTGFMEATIIYKNTRSK